MLSSPLNIPKWQVILIEYLALGVSICRLRYTVQKARAERPFIEASNQQLLRVQ